MPNTVHNLNHAKQRKNDIFYTRYADIDNELSHYSDFLHGKIIYCPTDEPNISNFYFYLKNNFQRLKIRKLICTHYLPSPLPSLFDSYPISGKPKKSTITADGETITDMMGDGDFRSDECRELMEEADIVITNPPFSLFRDFFQLLQNLDKLFLIIGSLNAITYNCFFPSLMRKEVWTGRNHPKRFKTPDGTTKTFNNIRWWTNLGEYPQRPPMILESTYDAQNYPFYDEFEAIEVSRLKLIPKDYEGIMGVPITFFEKWDGEQFLVVGKTSHRGKGEFDLCDSSINGKSRYDRVLIKRKC